MPNSIEYGRCYEFSQFRLEAERRRLSRHGEPILLPPKAMDALLALVERQGKVVEREELLLAVWGDTIIEDANLTVAISTLRKVLGQHQSEPLIETIPRVGYRFVAKVREVEAAPLVSESGLANAAPTPEVVAHQPPQGRRWRRFRAPLLVGLAAALVGGVIYYRQQIDTSRPALSVIRSLAVLPLQTLGASRDEAAAKDDESLRLRLTDALITQLSILSQVTVRPTSAVLRYAKMGLEPRVAGQQLAVDAVLEGHVQRADGRTRVTLQMLRVNDGAQIWAQQFDEAMTDTFALQDAVAAKVVQSLSLQLNEAERARLTQRPTENQEAYENYLKGRYFLRLENQGISDDQMRLTYFKKALELDPNFELAWVGLADGYQFLYNAGIFSQQATIVQAKESVAQALQLNPQLPEAHATLAVIYEQYDWDWARAEAAYSQSLKLNPNNFTTRQRFGWYLAKQGHFAAAEEQFRQALRLDPLSVNANFYYGATLLFAHRYEEAAAQLQKTIGLDANYSGIYWNLARVYHMQKNFAEAVAALQQALLIEQRPHIAEQLKQTYATAGYKAALQVLLEHMHSLINQKYTPYNLASQYARIEDKDLTLHWLAEAVTQRDRWLPQVKVSPEFDFLRADARFHDLLVRARLLP